jgi:hypothetical protein
MLWLKEAAQDAADTGDPPIQNEEKRGGRPDQNAPNQCRERREPVHHALRRRFALCRCASELS